MKISQCIVVKNNEDFLELCLESFKNIVDEVVVIDYGSTDKSIEIAKKYNAKIFETDIMGFDNLYNLAKEKATGDFLLFTEVIDFILEKDAKKLRENVENIVKYNETTEQKIDIIPVNIYSLNADKKIYRCKNSKSKLIRNSDTLKFYNEVFPEIISENMIFLSSENLTIYENYDKNHKTYVYRKEYIKNNRKTIEDDIYYLECCYELEEYGNFNEVLNKISNNNDSFSLNLTREHIDKFYYIKLLDLRCNNLDDEQILFVFYDRYKKSFGDNLNPDIIYNIGLNLLYKRSINTKKFLLKALEIYNKDPNKVFSEYYFPFNLATCYKLLAICYKSDKANKAEIVKYIVLSLKFDKLDDDNLKELLTMFKDENQEAVFKILSDIYDFNDLKDKLFVIRIAKSRGMNNLIEIVKSTFTDEENEFYCNNIDNNLSNLKKREELKQKYYYLNVKNIIDINFLKIIDDLEKNDEELLLNQVQKLNSWVKKNKSAYERLVSKIYNFEWPKLNLDRKIYDFIKTKIDILKENRENILWLYQNLENYASKARFVAILDNLLNANVDSLYLSRSVDLYENNLLDQLKISDDFIMIDVGVGKGKNIFSFLFTYGLNYSKIYGYDMDKVCTENLIKDFENYDNIFIENKAILNNNDIHYLKDTEFGKKITKNDGNGFVVTETLDSLHLGEKISLLTIDSCGSELEVLEGASEIIKQSKPIIMSTCHYNFDDIYKISRYIKSLREDYKLYINYIGDFVAPDFILLYAV